MNRSIYHQAVVFVCMLFVTCFAIGTQAAEPGAGDEQARQKVNELVEQARQVPEHEYTIRSWNDMRSALNTAREAGRSDDASLAELREAFNELKRSMSGLEKRELQQAQLPEIGLSASLFATSDRGPINNVALQWATSGHYEKFEVYRASQDSGPFEKIYEGAGRSCNDYALAEGTYYYRLKASSKDGSVESSVESITTRQMPTGLSRISNESANEKRLREQTIKVGDTYYEYRRERDGTSLIVTQWTSPDLEHWTQGPVVMDRNSHPDMADVKFEAGTQFYDARHDKIVWWCHWELSGPRYGHGRAMVATATPGQPFTIHHIYNPLDVQVRDMSIFRDEDGQGYLVAASNVLGQGANATLYIFKMNDDYTDVTEIVAKVMEGGYREAPHIVKHGEFYYFFFSQAAGWYPSRGGYVSSRSLYGPWSEPRSIGNNSTFSSQSGPIIEFGDSEPYVRVMAANRWIRGDSTSRKVIMPVRFADGFAFFDYVPYLLYDVARKEIVPVELGQLLSQDGPAEASIPGSPGNEVTKAFDGDYDTFFRSDQKDWPFEIGVDLGSPCVVKNVQTSWYIHKGSEGYYTYTIDGSLDGKKWTTLLDRTDTNDTIVSKTYGFTSDVLEKPGKVRYVRLTVHGAHLHNNPNNWYSPTIYEMKVYGENRSATR